MTTDFDKEFPEENNSEKSKAEQVPVVYHPETLLPLTANGLLEVSLGQVVLEGEK